jgi:D-proline reductase (dithiol) PrdB
MQSVGLLQAAIEREGIPTVAVTFNADFTQLIGTPRALAVRFPYGAPFGNPLNRWLQTRVLAEALTLLDEATARNTIRASEYRWKQTREKVAW